MKIRAQDLTTAQLRQLLVIAAHTGFQKAQMAIRRERKEARELPGHAGVLRAELNEAAGIERYTHHQYDLRYQEPAHEHGQVVDIEDIRDNQYANV